MRVQLWLLQCSVLQQQVELEIQVCADHHDCFQVCIWVRLLSGACAYGLVDSCWIGAVSPVITVVVVLLHTEAP